MRTKKVKFKKLIPIFASMSVLSGPVIFVIGCGVDDIIRYPAGLTPDNNNRLLFSFAGVNYFVTAKTQFSNDYQANISFIKQKIEFIMGQQKMYEFFADKLKYNHDDAMNAVKTIVNQLGLNALANAYTDALNSGSSFDSTSGDNNASIFETQDWNTYGSSKLDYSAYEKFDTTLNPNDIFTKANLTSDLDNATDNITNKMSQIIDITDKNYTEIAGQLMTNPARWTNQSSTVPTLPTWSEANPTGTTTIPVEQQQAKYEKAVNRFKLWLRFRYQQYYQTKILPDLGVNLFTMANILDSIFKVDTSGTKSTITVTNSKYAQQLQTWSVSDQWTSNYRLAFDYSTTISNANTIEKNWGEKTSSALPEMITTDENQNYNLNQKFVDQFRGSNDETVANSFDSTLGVYGYTNGTGRPYSSATTFTSAKTTAGWVTNGTSASSHYWVNNQKASFVYVAPIYLIDVVKNLNLNLYKSNQDPNDSLTPIVPDNLNSLWHSTANAPISNSPLSTYIRGDGKIEDSTLQNLKLSMFWQMLYYLADQNTKTGSSTAADNFTTAANILYPEYINKENIYDKILWDAISTYYTS